MNELIAMPSELIEILTQHGDFTKREALELIHETREMIEDCNYDPEESAEIIMENLGVQPDYFMDEILLFG